VLLLLLGVPQDRILQAVEQRRKFRIIGGHAVEPGQQLLGLALLGEPVVHHRVAVRYRAAGERVDDLLLRGLVYREQVYELVQRLGLAHRRAHHAGELFADLGVLGEEEIDDVLLHVRAPFLAHLRVPPWLGSGWCRTRGGVLPEG
jgi:hypothetical protein